MKLNGKKVKINGKKFTVSEHLSNVDGNVETIILTRPISKRAGVTTENANTLQELGYMNEDDVVYTDTEMEVAGIQIKERIGAILPITMILQGDVLKDTDVQIIGRNWEDPDLIDMLFLEDETTVSINAELLTKSYLLHQERNGKFIPNTEDRDSRDSRDEEADTPNLDRLVEMFANARDSRGQRDEQEPQETNGLDGLLKGLTGLLDDVIEDIDELEDAIDEKVERRRSRSRGHESPEDLLKKILDSRSSFHEDKDSKDFSIEEIEMEDAPDEVQRLIRHLRNRSRRK